MGKPLSKPNERLRSIDREVSSLRSSVRSSNRKFSNESKDQLVETLVKHSNEVNALKGKVNPRHLEQVQSNISHTMEDILSKNSQEPDLDMGAIETNSFVQLQLSKRQMSNKDLSNVPPKKHKSSHVELAKASNTTLQDIEEKLRTLKPQISVAIEQEDLTQLRVQQNTIKVLVTDLEMIKVKEHTPLDDKKKKLDKSIISQYQKITKVMQEIRRHKDLNYLVQQKGRILNHLEDIQKELSEIESVVLKLTQESDQSIIKGLRENLLNVKQRLSSIEAVDENIKQKQAQLLKKHAEILKSIEDGLNDSSQSDLVKAQMNYEELIRNIASGNSLDKDEIKVKLESLQSFISGIKDDNENVFRGKQQLLNNVRQSFSFILDKEQKIENTEVGFVKKQDTNDLNEVSIYDVRNNWEAFQKIINSKSEYDWSETYKILDEIQQSIEETKHEIEEKSNIPLNKKFNHSTPNLSSSKPLHSKFGSNKSVDLVGQSPIKTRAKVYNLSTPQIQNINDQQVVLRNKQFYKNSLTRDDKRPFSKIEEIKTQVNYIKEKYDESSQKQHLRNKLESYIEIINGYAYHQNQMIANNAKKLLLEIQDMLKNISEIPQAMNDTSQRRSSIELSFENVVGIQGSIEQLEQMVSALKGEKGDPEYKNIVGRLSECRKYLETIVIPPKYDMIQQQKEEILNKIEVTFNTLESKSFTYEDAEILSTKKSLENLKEKVKRFSGAYKGVLYNQIEKDLNKLLVNVTETVVDKTISEDIMKDIEKHLKILEHRATKDQSFRRTFSDSRFRNEDEDKLIKLKNDLADIKTTIDTTPTTAVNLFLGLKSRLDLVKLGLDQLKVTLEEEAKEKDILYNEVETLKNMVEAKTSLAKEAIRQWSQEQDKDKIELEELRKIEERFKTLKSEIEAFVGTTSDNKFYELDENSSRLILRLDKLQLERGSDGHKRKIDLLKDIYSYGDLLDQRAKEGEDILEIERSVYDLDKNFERNLKLNDLENLQEKILNLQTRLNNGQFNNNLLQRKQTCTKSIENLKKKIAEYRPKSTSEEVEPSNTDDPKLILSHAELQFRNIKKDIDSFSGIRSDSGYRQINSHLTTLFLSLDNLNFPEGTEMYSTKTKLLKAMHEYTQILENKAKQCETFQDIHNQLNDVYKKLNNYKGKGEELTTIENELKSIQGKMVMINIRENDMKSLDQKFQFLVGEYNRFKKQSEIPNIAEGTNAEIYLNKNILSAYPPRSPGYRLAEIENEIYLLRKRVITFINNDSSEEYKTIEDTLLRLKMRLAKIDTQRNSEFIKKQHQLEEAIEDCFKILDERSLETANVMEIEEALDKIHDQLRIAVNEDEKSVVDEKLISLQIKLGNLRVNEDLVLRKNKCIQRVLNYSKQLKGPPLTPSQSNPVL